MQRRFHCIECCIGIRSTLRVHSTPGGLDGRPLIDSGLNEVLVTAMGRLEPLETDRSWRSRTTVREIGSVVLYRSLYRKALGRARNHRIHTIQRKQLYSVYTIQRIQYTTLYTLPLMSQVCHFHNVSMSRRTPRPQSDYR